MKYNIAMIIGLSLIVMSWVVGTSPATQADISAVAGMLMIWMAILTSKD